MSIFEYDQEKHMRQEREQAWEEGREAGLAEGEAKGKAAGIAEGKAAGMEDKLMEQIRKKLEKGRSVTQIAEDLEEEEAVIKKIMEKL